MLNYIYWGNQPNNNYRYGSAMTVRADQSVQFVNRLMAPGKTLVKWHSAGNYQAQRVVPQLPELLSKQAYQFKAVMKVKPAARVMLRASFYDAQGDVIKEFQAHGDQLTVTCPLEVVSYTVELINLGCWELDFKRLEISDQGTEQNIMLPTLSNPILGQPVSVLLLETRRTSSGIDYNALAKQRFVPNLLPVVIPWQERNDAVDWAKMRIEQAIPDHGRVNLIGTSPATNALVHQLIEQQSAWNGFTLAPDELPINPRIERYQISYRGDAFWQSAVRLPIMMILQELRDRLGVAQPK